VVTKMDWINPHSWIHLEVTDAKGQKGGVDDRRRRAETRCLRRGWNRTSLPAGTKIMVLGFQAKDGSFRANGRDITFRRRQRKLFRRLVRHGCARRAPLSNSPEASYVN